MLTEPIVIPGGALRGEIHFRGGKTIQKLKYGPNAQLASSLGNLTVAFRTNAQTVEVHMAAENGNQTRFALNHVNTAKFDADAVLAEQLRVLVKVR